MSPEEHIEVSLGYIREIYQKAVDKIEALPTDKRLPITKLAEELSLELGVSSATLYHILKYLVNSDYPNAKVFRGKHGGIQRNPPNLK